MYINPLQYDIYIHVTSSFYPFNIHFTSSFLLLIFSLTRIEPLYNLLHKESDFKWTKEHQSIFEQMKRTSTHKLELTMPDTTKPFYIITDASNTGIGAALLQQRPTTEKKMRLVSAN